MPLVSYSGRHLIRSSFNSIFERMNKKFIYISVVYILVVLAFAVYFATNLFKFVHIKGDEFSYCVEVLLIFTYTFYTILYFAVFKKGMIFLLLAPIGLVVVSVILGFLEAMVLKLGLTPVQIVYVYSITYSYLAIGAVVYWRYLAGDFA